MYSKRLIELRKEAKLTQLEFSKEIGIHRARYCQYENESDIIPINHLIYCCNYFNVSLDYIFGFINFKKYDNYKEENNNKLSGLRLKELRKENHLTLKEFGDILKCSYGTIAGYESGRYTIATPFLYDICKKYKISADYLLGKTNNPKPPELSFKNINNNFEE